MLCQNTADAIENAFVNKQFILLPCLLLLAAASSMAMSLGRHSGATFIGRPLDISVQAVLEAQGDVSSLCLEADVFYADNKLDKSRVGVSIERSPTLPSQALIRIRSAVLVDEPIVTLYVRAGCQPTTERRYVTLSELVPETLSDRNTLTPMPALAPSAASIRPGVVPPPNTAAPGSSGSQVSAPQAARSVNLSGARSPGAAAQAVPGNAMPGNVALAPLAQPRTSRTNSQRAPIKAQSSNASASARARLKLEPLDLLIERDPQLKASAELLSIPAADPRERAAASALWQSLSAQPQDILRENEKLQTLENSVRGLQAQSQKNVSAINDLNVKLQKAQSERYANGMVYALAALLLAALAGLVFLFRHRLPGERVKPRDAPWWRNNEAYVNQQKAWRDRSSPPEQNELGANQPDSIPESKRVDIDVDFDLNQAGSEPGSNRSAVTPAFVGSELSTPKTTSGFGSGMHPGRAVKAEELFDVQQQADFFVSIGQHEQAIEVLQNHIAEESETSALVYLDLFDLYHQLKRPADYDSLRASFNQRFNAEVPTFELYKNKGLGLESYNLALSRIEALWPSSKVLEIIEESLFRRPETSAEAFNLEAYRELLLLYSVAREIIGNEPRPSGVSWDVESSDLPDDPVDSGPISFMPTAIQPLSAVLETSQPGPENQSVNSSMSSASPFLLRLGLDIDLSRPFVHTDKADFDSVSDSRFFAQFDAEATISTLPPSLALPTPAAGAKDSDHLLDFDAFDVPQATSGNSKPPTV